jgi:hypothetical protein
MLYEPKKGGGKGCRKQKNGNLLHVGLAHQDRTVDGLWTDQTLQEIWAA